MIDRHHAGEDSDAMSSLRNQKNPPLGRERGLSNEYILKGVRPLVSVFYSSGREGQNSGLSRWCSIVPERKGGSEVTD